MQNRVSAFVLLILLAAFLYYCEVLSNRPRVLGALTPTVLQVDLNGNNRVDDGETLCIPGVETFTSSVKNNSEKLAERAGVPYAKSLAVGYLTDGFVKSEVISKNVKVQFLKTSRANCREANVFINSEDYASILFRKGFGLKDGLPQNKTEFEKLLKTTEKLNLVIFNHKSKKFHTLDCKYGLVASDSIIMPKRDLPHEAKGCKFCNIKKSSSHSSSEEAPSDVKYLPPPPNMITDGSLKLILTDFTTILKPDRNCRHLVCKELVTQINSARNSIDIALYGWANIKEVNKALDSAQSRGVKVRIVYDTKTKGENYYTETDEFVSKFADKRSDYIPQKSVLTNALMHNKFAVFDNKTVYTGSMNFSTTGLSGFNHNNVVVINSVKIANLYTKEFEQMYEGKFHSLKSKTKNNSEIKIGDSEISVYFSPQDKGLSQNLAPLVHQAKNYIYLPAFLITHPKLTEELKLAHSRGVKVKMIIDATNTSTRHSTFYELRKFGIPIKVENFAGKMHAKAMIIDDEYLVLGSTNFSNSGENKNDENMLIIKNPRLAKLYKDYFEYFWVKIPDKYLTKTVKAESKYSVGSCSDGLDNDHDGKIDRMDEDCK